MCAVRCGRVAAECRRKDIYMQNVEVARGIHLLLARLAALPLQHTCDDWWLMMRMGWCFSLCDSCDQWAISNLHTGLISSACISLCARAPMVEHHRSRKLRLRFSLWWKCVDEVAHVQWHRRCEHAFGGDCLNIRWTYSDSRYVARYIKILAFRRHKYYMCITRHTAPTNRMQKWCVRLVHRSLHSLNNHHHPHLTLASCVDSAFRGVRMFRPKQTVKAKGFSVLQFWADWLPCETYCVPYPSFPRRSSCSSWSSSSSYTL